MKDNNQEGIGRLLSTEDADEVGIREEAGRVCQQVGDIDWDENQWEQVEITVQTDGRLQGP